MEVCPGEEQAGDEAGTRVAVSVRSRKNQENSLLMNQDMRLNKCFVHSSADLDRHTDRHTHTHRLLPSGTPSSISLSRRQASCTSCIKNLLDYSCGMLRVQKWELMIKICMLDVVICGDRCGDRARVCVSCTLLCIHVASSALFHIGFLFVAFYSRAPRLSAVAPFEREEGAQDPL